MTTRLLIFGGTFDPPHRAHVELAAIVAERTGCDRVLFVPAARNPLKPGGPRASDADRVAMVRLAARAIPGAEVSTVEIDRGGPSFFVETLETLRASLARSVELRFLIGADQAVQFDRWRDWRGVLELARPVVLLRRPWTRERLESTLVSRHGDADARVWLDAIVDAPLIDVSASEIRRRLARGADTSDVLDLAVAAYIRDHALYHAPRDP